MIHQGNFLDVSCIPLPAKQGGKDPERKENHGRAKGRDMSAKFKHLRYNHMNIYISHLKKMKRNLYQIISLKWKAGIKLYSKVIKDPKVNSRTLCCYGLL